ncbi:hypothetical protein L500_1551 [Bordetella holmesii CDC-H643-BH]|nr:hypothetical protein D556_3646 [Bordetella holmesii 41130]KAK82554.1 hypothetical protein L503_1420 [Bordetella holmesii CDC-H809-BH]KCV01473.1 hypothetical protein L498_1451 [Bordetella holmesii CDC-H629-BH]KCV19491.1 hypothetical protein L500_1551 [Bordetella holmesii CDC-H643-BH]
MSFDCIRFSTKISQRGHPTPNPACAMQAGVTNVPQGGPWAVALRA